MVFPEYNIRVSRYSLISEASYDWKYARHDFAGKI